MEMKKMLACFAHPDDETFGCGGVLSHYASQGVTVELVCATRGEAGEIARPDLATPENLAEVRTQELQCAASILGISEVHHLNYRDSGMSGTPENLQRQAFINQPDEVIIQQLVAIIRKFQPQVIITFEPGGGYGHPDHIKISRNTTDAFHQAARPEAYPHLGDIWKTARLFYTSIPRSFFSSLQQRLEQLGLDSSQLANYSEGDAGWPDESIDISMDISDCVDQKWSAFQCHRTQLGSSNLFLRLPEEEMKQRLSREGFALANRESTDNIRLTHLFDGL